MKVFEVTCSYGKFRNVVIFMSGLSYGVIKNKIINLLNNKYDIKDKIIFNNMRIITEYIHNKFVIQESILRLITQQYENKGTLLFRYKLNRLIENEKEIVLYYYYYLKYSFASYEYAMENFNLVLENLKNLKNISEESLSRILEVYINININKFTIKKYNIEDICAEIEKNVLINLPIAEIKDLNGFLIINFFERLKELIKYRLTNIKDYYNFFLYIKQMITTNYMPKDHIVDYIVMCPYLIFALDPNDDYVRLLPNDFVFDVNIILKESKDVKKYINSKKLTIESKKILINKFINFDSIFPILNKNVFYNDKYAEFLISKFSNFFFFFPIDYNYIEYITSNFDCNSSVLKQNKDVVKKYLLSEEISKDNKINIINKFGSLHKISLLFGDEIERMENDIELNKFEMRIYDQILKFNETETSNHEEWGFDEYYYSTKSNKIYFTESIILEYNIHWSEHVHWRSDGEYNGASGVAVFANVQIFDDNIIIEEASDNSEKISLVVNKKLLAKIIAYILNELYKINEI